MKIVIPGGTGFIGQYSIPRLRALGHDVIVVSRHERAGEPASTGKGALQAISWGDARQLSEALDGAGAVINLAGKSVDCRYTEKNKREIMRSRVDATRAVADALSRCHSPAPVWLNASTATIYRDSRDQPMTEASGGIDPTGDFSVQVATAWEHELFAPELPGVRRIAMRIAIALGRSAGMMPPVMSLARFGLGGRWGDGRQMVSWIHIDDLYRAMLFMLENETVSGPVNVVAPFPISNDEFMRLVREKMGVPFGLPAAKWMLELGALIRGTETELLLKSRWVLPAKLEAAGFQFLYPDMASALQQIICEQ